MIELLARHRLGVEEGLDDAHERVGHGVRVDRQSQRAPPHLLPQELTQEIGLDAAIDYRSEPLPRRVAELFPRGINVFFDNVGGEILDAALARLAVGARVALCGAISSYNDSEGPRGPRNYTNLIVYRARMQGFLVSDFAARFGEAVADLARWVAEKKLRDQVDLVDGLENAPDAFRRLFRGENRGKQLVRIAEPSGRKA